MLSSNFFSKLKKPIIFLTIFTLVLILLVALSLIFKISQVMIVGSASLHGLDSLHGKFIFFVDPKKTATDLYARNANIDTILIKKVYPNKLLIEVTQNKPSGTLLAGGGYFLLSDKGRIIAKSRQLFDQKPFINSFEKINFNSYVVGDSLTGRDILYSLYFARSLYEVQFITETVDISGFDVLVFKGGEKSIYTTLSKDPKEAFMEVKQVLQHLRVEGKDFVSVDVRFDKPVIKLK